MKRQSGCISIDRDKWCLRWREKVIETGERKLRFKILGSVTSEHRRNKDRSTKKLRVPAEIQTAADAVMSSVNIHPDGISVLLTIGDLVEKHYLPDAEKYLKESTLQGYKGIWRLYLKALVFDIVVRDFHRADAFKLWQAINLASQNKLSRRTMAHIRFFMSGIFEWALNHGFYSGLNPANADLPHGLPKGKETTAYSIEEIARMLSLLADVKAQAIIAVAFGAGLRKGEIAGLRWEDYNPTDTGAVIHVRQAVWHGKITTVKTASSDADVNLGSEFCIFVDAYRQLCGGVRLGLMFGYSADHPVNLDSFATAYIRPVLKAAGIPWRGYHGFRRGNATFLARHEGASVAALMLRHSDVGTTEAHYIKTSAQERRAAEAKKVITITAQKEQAAESLSAGLSAVRKQAN
jgi:integrase